MAGKPYKFSDEQITQALMTLVACSGNPRRAAEAVDFDVSPDTIRKWRDQIHAERYQRMQEEHGQQLEVEAIALARENAVKAAEAERKMIERTEALTAPDLVSGALRALADSKAKSIDKVLALTGRPVSPKDDGANLGKMLESMVAKGYLKVNVQLPETVDHKGPVEEES